MLTLELTPHPPTEPRDVAVVIDVLRMTTTATTLFTRGLDELFVVAEVEAARALARERAALLLGERGGVKLSGFDGGNSPLELPDSCLGRAVLCTSNGSAAASAAADAKHLLLGAIVNARAVAKVALARLHHGVTLICAGTGGRVSFDDALGAACIARELLRLEPTLPTSDAVTLLLRALASTPDLHEGLLAAQHAQQLVKLGFATDIAFAAQLNQTTVVAERQPGSPARFVGVDA